jgi:hypothetical protein
MSSPPVTVVAVMVGLGYNLPVELLVYPYLNNGNDDHVVTQFISCVTKKLTSGTGY